MNPVETTAKRPFRSAETLGCKSDAENSRTGKNESADVRATPVKRFGHRGQMPHWQRRGPAILYVDFLRPPESGSGLLMSDYYGDSTARQSSVHFLRR